MVPFIGDASVVLPWCFLDEATAWTDSLLDRLIAGDSMIVPAHWATEVSNGLIVGVRRKRIEPDGPALFWDKLAGLPIKAERPLTPERAKAALTLCAKHGLTAYDAAYLELAMRRGVELATQDDALQRAARLETVRVNMQRI